MVVIPELNVIKKDWRKVDLKIALCYPNVYRVGMTGLTVRLLYALLNSHKDVLCERFFFPTLHEPLRSLESNQSLKKFDIIAFSLQYEEDYLKVMWMLLESGIPLRSDARKLKDPLIIAGGPCATANPEPLAEYIDLFVIGEVEPILNSLIDSLTSFKKPFSRIEKFADIKGVYIPKISNPTKRVWINDINKVLHPLAQQIPLVEKGNPYLTIFGKAFATEIVRGCNRFCKFCLLCHISQPKRQRRLENIENVIEEGIKYTPVDKISLIGASIFDYPDLEELCEFIVSHKLKISIPSLRPENVTERLAFSIAEGQQRSISMAPDAASVRMQNKINKKIDEGIMKDAIKTFLSYGINQLKLYFIIGLPGETIQDINSIITLSKKIAEMGYGRRGINLSINPLIPKPHTPFQWEKAPSVSYVRECIKTIRKNLKGDNRITISSFDPRHAQIQAFLSLGGRKTGKVIEFAARYGGGLGSWRRALKKCKMSLKSNFREKYSEEPLPWDRIKTGF